MGIQRRNLNIVFHDIQPEMLYGSICRSAGRNAEQMYISAAGVGMDVFQSVARLRYPSYSYEEISNIHRQMVRSMVMESDMGAPVSSVFHLLVRMGQRVLRHAGDGVVCDFSETMAWRNVSLELRICSVGCPNVRSWPGTPLYAPTTTAFTLFCTRDWRKITAIWAGRRRRFR